MNFNELNKDNFLLFSIKNYENPHSSTLEEFEEDLKRFKYVKRWLKKYHETGTINSHLLLNHIIVIFNCWNDAAVPMFFYKIDKEYWGYIKSFLLFLERIPEWPSSGLDDIKEDINILSELKGSTNL
tara:strand:+ start:10 stop:390 length:381 start_codon:yes stop_codon:yes gene_type:complete